MPLTTHLNGVSSLRMCGTISLRPLYAFVGYISTTLSLGKDFCRIATKISGSSARGDSADNCRAQLDYNIGGRAGVQNQPCVLTFCRRNYFFNFSTPCI